MTTATIAVKGSASDDFPADYATLQFGHEFHAAARSEALAGGNSVITQLRDTVAHVGADVREMKVQSLRVQETFDHVGPDHVREHTGWVAQLGGQLLIEPGAVPSSVAELIRIGVTVYQLTWHLDPDTELQAHRAVRRLAVADAKEAANDFALALGADLGSLIALADPGLLGAAYANATRGSSHMRMASATSGASWDGYVDIDPELITISANVEASYEVTLT
ncbi:MAG TPA: SIMPL domain-containing protein [Acidimicrobiales bacterium]|jgi:uncharacterized protein YggE|nr:SIMPL domain-containing protein [Acidimicrobiales bacterium]